MLADVPSAGESNFGSSTCNDRSRYGRFTNSANSRANSDSLNPLASPATSRALERKKESPCWAAGRQRRTRPALRPPGRQGHADRDTTGPPCPDRRFRIQEGAGGTSCLWRTSGPGGQVLPRRASLSARYFAQPTAREPFRFLPRQQSLEVVP